MRVKVNSETAREVLYAGGVVWHQDEVDDMSLGAPGWALREGRLCRQITPFMRHGITTRLTLGDVLAWADCEIEIPEERMVKRKPAKTVEQVTEKPKKGHRRGLQQG